jgi:hypothetical protein
MPCERRFQILAAAHLALGVVTRALAPVRLPTAGELDHILVVPYVASALCQALLLSLWGVTSQAPLWKRSAGLVAGAVYLEAMVPSDLRREFQFVSTTTIAVVTASLIVVQWFGVRLRRQADVDEAARAAPEGLRFSIRGIMIVTAAVALLCAGARAAESAENRMALLILIWAICFVAVGLIALWAALGNARPVRRAPAVFVLSPVLGAFFAFAARAHSAGWVYILLIMLLYPMALFGSLLVVRSCGYRLVRWSV